MYIFIFSERLEREEAERLAAATPVDAGPDYSEYDLRKLVTFVKNMTILYDLLVSNNSNKFVFYLSLFKYIN